VTAPAGRTRRSAPRSDGPIFGHQPALDGLRGVAALLVVFYHLNLGWASGGFVGIDVFFVLSGFLITTLLLDEVRGRSQVDLLGFWRRRFARLLPLAFLVITLTMVWAWRFADPQILGRVRRDGISSLLYVNNWVQLSDGVGYFDRFGPPSPLTHMWSLSVEEQFYVLWPLGFAVIVAAGRNRGHSWMTIRRRVAAVGSIGALLLFAWTLAWSLAGASGSSLYLRTDTRAAELLVGCGLAAWRWDRWVQRDGTRPREPLRPVIDAAGLVGLGVIALTTSIGLDPDIAARGGFALLSVATAAIVSAAILPGTVTSRLLSLAPLRAAGRISYGLYLWHWPIFVAIDAADPSWPEPATIACKLALTVAASAASLRLLELPLRRPGRLRLRTIPAVAGLVGLIVVACTAGAVESDQSRFLADEERAAAPPTVPPPPPPPAVTRTLVLGDSYGAAVTSGWAAAGDVTIDDATDPNCGPFRFAGTGEGPEITPPCSDWRASLAEPARAGQIDVVMVIARSWPALSQDESLRTTRFAFDLSQAQGLVTDELGALADTVSGLGASLILATTPTDVLSEPEQLPAGITEQAAPSLAVTRPDEVTVLDLATGCPTPCGPESFGVTLTSGPPIATMPTPTGVTRLRALVAPAARADHLARIERRRSTAVASSTPKVLLVGDSVAWSLGSYFYGRSSTPPPDAPLRLWPRGTFECELDSNPRVELRGVVELKTKCANWRADWAGHVQQFDPDLAMAVIGTWEVFDRQIDGRTVKFATPEWDANMTRILDDVVDVLGASGARVVLATPPPTRGQKNDRGTPTEWKDPSGDRFIHIADLMRQVGVRRPEVTVVELSSFVCPTIPCPAQVSGTDLRPDGVHYDANGGPVVAGWLTPRLQALTRVRSA